MTNISDIAKQIVAENTKHGYSPVIFDRGYSDTHDEALSLFVAGDDRWREIAYDVLDEWYIQSVWMDARELVREDVSQHGNIDIDEVELHDLITDYLHNACTQDYALEWLENMRYPLVRVQIDGQSDPVFAGDGEVTPVMLLEQAGIEPTEENLTAAQVIIDNALSNYNGAYYNLFLVFQVSVSDLAKNGDQIHVNGEVELWATNVYQGDGMSETVNVDLVLPRKNFATDDDAPGYSYCDVFGTSAGYLPHPIVKVIQQEATA